MRMEKKGKQRDPATASVTHASGKIQHTVERALFPVLSASIEPRVSFREVRPRPRASCGECGIFNLLFVCFFVFFSGTLTPS